MSELAKSEMKSSDEPLFVLRYQQRKVIPLAVLWLLAFGPLGTYCLFAHVPRSTFDLIFARSFGFLSLLVCVAAVTEMLLFKEVRLYGDRIVKVWKLIGARELELSKAGLCSAISISGNGQKVFFKQEMSTSWLIPMAFFHSMGITYHEYFVDERKVKQLNCVLAELTGRKVAEFEKMGVMEKILK